MKLKKSDIIILLVFYLLTLSPLLLQEFTNGKQYINGFIFWSSFSMIYFTHMTALSIRFRKWIFSILWLLMIILNGLLYYKTLNIWIPLLINFSYFHLLRFIFFIVTKEISIPFWVSRSGHGLEFNKSANRMENKRDLIFTLCSFIIGLFLYLFVFVKVCHHY